MMNLHENQELFEEVLFVASHDVKDGGIWEVITLCNG